MSTLRIVSAPARKPAPRTKKSPRVESIDLLRGTVMIIMALDHVRDYFSGSAFLYSPTDMEHTSVPLFFTRWITHYCAPIFVFLAGISAHLYGATKTKKQLSFFLFTRGLWLVLAELFIVTLGWTFNPTYPIFNLQVIWAIGICMITLSAMVYLPVRLILLTGVLLIAGHNLLDNVHVPGTGLSSILWGFLHDPGEFVIGNIKVLIRYPILPWIGIMATGYYFGRMYTPAYDAEQRRGTLIILGFGAIALFVVLRSANIYGDAAHWSIQKSGVFSLLSFLNTTKYPPSLLYTLMTLGPALLFLAITEKIKTTWTARVQVFGRVPMFYYLAHIYLIHSIAIIGVMWQGYSGSAMIFLPGRVNQVTELKGYGYSLVIVYLVWIGVVLFLYPCSKWFDRYKRANQSKKWWLSYL
ncbi:DUF1624 domain-containing protein [Flavitalea flava]